MSNLASIQTARTAIKEIQSGNPSDAVITLYRLIKQLRQPVPIKTVKVSVEGGVIQDVDVPKGVKVKVFDFDIEGTEEDRLSKSDDGNDCVLSEWEHVPNC